MDDARMSSDTGSGNTGASTESITQSRSVMAAKHTETHIRRHT
jgi:hypothetical protein